MGAFTDIEWADSTLNFWFGCTKKSPGCKNCYADAMTTRFGRNCFGPKGLRDPINWKKGLRDIQQRATRGDVSKNGTRNLMVFVNDMSDLFESPETMPEASRELVAELRKQCFRVVEENPNLIFQLLTKRPENIMDMVPHGWRDGFPPNAWVMTSCEDHDRLQERVPLLCSVPARVRGLSCEPLLGALGLYEVRSTDELTGSADDNPFSMGFVHWVIIGGESGAGARSMELTWAQNIADDCSEYDVPVFVKQLGSNPTRFNKRYTVGTAKGGDIAEFPKSLQRREWPKIVRELEGAAGGR